MSSSSATICASAVAIPWPSSTLPERTSTSPSGRKRSHWPRRRLTCRLPGSFGRSPPPPAASRKARFIFATPPAARRTARTSRLCEPQRQRLRSSAARTSASAGRGVLREQRGGAHEDAREAVAALRRLLVDHRALQRMRVLRRAEAFQGDDRLADCRPERRVAGRDRPPVDQHEARPALAGAAAEARGLQAEVVAQDVEEGRVLGGGDFVLGAVDGEADGHRVNPPSRRRSSRPSPTFRCPDACTARIGRASWSSAPRPASPSLP